MKPIFKLFLLSFVILFTGCYSAQKNTPEQQAERERIAKEKLVLGAVCPPRADEEAWRKQTVDQMRSSRNIPSVDFEFDSIILEHSSYETLEKVAQIMVANRNLKLVVEGHTDFVGSFEYNDWLSSARANAIKSFLVSRGVNSESIKTYGYGKRRPITSDDSPAGRACNRRVEFVLTTRHWDAIY